MKDEQRIDDMLNSIISSLEYARCAKANLETIVDMIPGIVSNPFFTVVRMQLLMCIQALEKVEISDGD